jgi:phosphoglucosamine mutase
MIHNISSNSDRLFGTDGIRGKTGIYPLTDGMLFKIGCGVVSLLHRKHKRKKQYTVIVGKDTRLSGQRIEFILSDALNAYGIDVLLAGTIPTPGLSHLVSELKADMGIMISASHNKPSDNGIKLISEGGKKITLQDEESLEELIVSGLIQKPIVSEVKGKTIMHKGGAASYVAYLQSCFPGLDLSNYKVMVDCACGAAAGVATELFTSFNANVNSIHDFPSGQDINAGGVSDISYLQKEMNKDKNDIGIAFDGDGDRLMLVDETGAILDGDSIMAIIGLYLLRKNKLIKNTLVTTVASNQGLIDAIEANGGKVIRTSVGDKYVLQALAENNLKFGGEQAGQIICLDYSPVADAFAAGIFIMKIMKDTGKLLSALAAQMIKIPQVLINIEVKNKKPFHTNSSVWDAIVQSQKRLEGHGRLLVRYSGTEDLARIMIEGANESLIHDIASELGGVLKKEIGDVSEYA